MDKLSVRFITRKWAPAIGGMETYCLQLTEHIKDDVNLNIQALPGRNDGRAPSGFQIVFFGFKMAGKLMLLPQADVTHVSDMASWPLAFFAKLRHWKTRIVLSAHGSDLSYRNKRGMLPKLYKFYLEVGAYLLPSSIVLANSQWIADLAKEAGFDDVRVIPLASDITPPIEQPKRTQSLFFAGRVMRSKGTSFIIEEVLPLLPEHINLKVAGTVWEVKEESVLKNPRVNYLGKLDAKDLAEEYASALAVVVPSLSPEGFGLVAVEAALTRGIVLASNHTGLLEVCSDDLGILVRTGDAEDWANKIKQVAAWASSEREAFIRVSQSQAQNRYNWQRVAHETLQSYGSV